jgi:hypothetical protein
MIKIQECRQRVSVQFLKILVHQKHPRSIYPEIENSKPEDFKKPGKIK